MTSKHGKPFRAVATVMGLLLLLVVAGACSSGSDESIDLLKDPRVGLSHLNDELHTVRQLSTDPKLGFEHLNAELHAINGEDLLGSPTFGLAHLNDEFHAIKGTLADPNFGLAHLNDEFHTIKEMLAELSQQVQALQ